MIARFEHTNKIANVGVCFDLILAVLLSCGAAHKDESCSFWGEL